MSVAWRTPESADSAESLHAWQSFLSAQVMPIRAESDLEEGFSGSASLNVFGTLPYLTIRSRRQWQHWDAREIDSSERPWVFVSTMLDGYGWLHSARGKVRVGVGEVSFADSMQPCSLEFEGDFAYTSVMVPRDALMDIAPLATAAHGACIPGPTGAALGAFIQALTADHDRQPVPTAQRLGDHLLGMVITELEAITHRDAASLASRDQILLGQIKSHLLTCLPKGQLQIGDISHRFSLSPRKLQRLFSAEGTTLTRWLMTQRLERCRRDMLNPAFSDCSVSAIAASWGLQDPAYFARAFRQAYGTTPSLYRRLNQPS